MPDTHGAHSEQDAIKFMADIKELLETWLRASTAFMIAIKQGEAARAKAVHEGDNPLVANLFELGLLIEPIWTKVGPAAQTMIAVWVIAELKRAFKTWTKHD